MAGHSKWANIKHQKSRSDALKGKVFSRLAKEIITSVKQGGPDPKANSRLKAAIQKARIANMPSDNIERNIKKASSQDQSDYFSVTYELYGYGGVGIVVDALTDNRNRLASEMRIATNKKGGTIATPGSVLFNFDLKGVIQVAKESVSEENLFLAVTEAGAEDFESSEDVYYITTPPDLLAQVKEKIESLGITCGESSLQRIPKVSVAASGEDQKANLALVEWIEEIDDVDSVYHNMLSSEDLSP